MGILALIVLIVVELFFLCWSVVTKTAHRQEKSVARISEFAILALLLITGILEWSFRYVAIAVVLLIQAVLAAVALFHRKETPYKTSRVINRFFLTAVLYAGALFIAVLCPQYAQPAPSGSYQVATAKYTWTDTSRIEAYTDTGEYRKLTVEFLVS
jgi:heme O synthase-like polyprenyltransferase